MGIQQHAEKARAAREAREAVVRGAHAGDPLAVDAALRRYLAAEQYAREHHKVDQAEDHTEPPGEPTAEDEKPT
jgi:cytidylate kinase